MNEPLESRWLLCPVCKSKTRIRLRADTVLENLNTALYEKMAAEQDKYRDWLKSQPPEEILRHTYESTIREDILMAMEELELLDAQATAMLASPSPLADAYREFEKRETGYMDVVRDSIESRAEAALDAQRELSVYRHSAAYAREHGELDQYRTSQRANIACKEAIEAAISENYRDNRLDGAAVSQVAEQFGYDRMLYVLANTVQQKEWDGASAGPTRNGPGPLRCRPTRILLAATAIWSLWWTATPD